LGKKKLLEKAQSNPKNLRFSELCSLAEHFGLSKRPGKGSHLVYKWDGKPKFSITIQDKDGMAVPYQVKQFLNSLHEHGLIKTGEE
jgi:hypothetical protein